MQEDVQSDEDFDPAEELGFNDSYMEETQVARARGVPQYVSRSKLPLWAALLKLRDPVT